MKIYVLIAGVHDPKWPIRLGGNALPDVDADRQVMSPFDEAALEIALRIRDSNPAVSIRVFVAGGDGGAKIARAVAAFNPTEVATVGVETPWDQSIIAQTLAQHCGEGDLILIGREFGDYDDGLVPSMLAAKLSVDFFGRAQVVEAKNGVRLMRETGSFEERVAISNRLVASITNDRRTRLRKPLMKNVMRARQAKVESAEVSHPAPTGLQFMRVVERATSRTSTSCSMLEGTIEQQAQTLAALLIAARA